MVGKVVRGVEVGEGIDLIVEGDLGHLQAVVPGIDLASVLGQIIRELRQQAGVHHAEDRLPSATGGGYRQVCLLLRQCCLEACHQIGRQEGRSHGTMTTSG